MIDGGCQLNLTRGIISTVARNYGSDSVAKDWLGLDKPLPSNKTDYDQRKSLWDRNAVWQPLNRTAPTQVSRHMEDNLMTSNSRRAQG